MSETEKLNVWERNTAKTIKRIAMDCGYVVVGNHRCFELNSDNDHTNSFKVTLNAAGYFHVCQWEGSDWSRAVLSFDNSAEACLFGTYLKISMDLRAKRRRTAA